MIAELYHKTVSVLEDELTGNFFGTMRYMLFQRGLGWIFRHYTVSRDPEVMRILNTLTDDAFTLEFWKRSENGLVEIDGFIPFSDVGIGIEVKYRSGLSGEDQLEKEALVLQNEWCRKKEKILLLVADAEEAKQIYAENCTKPVFQNVHLAYLSWQDILLGLDQLPVVTPYGKTMIGDLKQLLTEKGFVAFDGFTWSKTEVEETLYYDFG